VVTTSQAASCAQLHVSVVTVTGACNKVRGRLQSVGWHELSCCIFPASQSTAYTHTVSLHH